MLVKVCGVTNLNDAIFAIENGAWAIGFNFHAKSPRYISLKAAKKIIYKLPPSIVKIGIFINKPYDFIINSIDEINLDLAQVNETFKMQNTSKKHRMILSLQAASEKELPDPHILKSFKYILLDAPRTKDGLLGGTGRKSNWILASKLAKNYRLILAGGLRVENIVAAINTFNPYAVDVASGIERTHGFKDKKTTKQFLEVCNHDK